LRKMTTIAINQQTWKRLQELKQQPDTMNDIIELLLNYYEDNEDTSTNNMLSDQEFDELIIDLHIPDKDFGIYLEKAHLSFKGKSNK